MLPGERNCIGWSVVLHTAQADVQLQSAWRCGERVAFHAAQRLPIPGQRHSLALCPLRREVPTEPGGQAPLPTRRPYFDFLHVGVMHNGMPAEALLHGKGLAAASMLAHEGALLLVEGEDVALEVEGGGVGAAAACPWTPAHVPLGGVHPHVLPQEVLALKRFLAHATPYVLFMGFSHVF